MGEVGDEFLRAPMAGAKEQIVDGEASTRSFAKRVRLSVTMHPAVLKYDSGPGVPGGRPSTSGQAASRLVLEIDSATKLPHMDASNELL